MFLRKLKASSDRHQHQAWLRSREAACWNQKIPKGSDCRTPLECADISGDVKQHPSSAHPSCSLLGPCLSWAVGCWKLSVSNMQLISVLFQRLLECETLPEHFNKNKNLKQVQTCWLLPILLPFSIRACVVFFFSWSIKKEQSKGYNHEWGEKALLPLNSQQTCVHSLHRAVPPCCKHLMRSISLCLVKQPDIGGTQSATPLGTPLLDAVFRASGHGLWAHSPGGEPRQQYHPSARS